MTPSDAEAPTTRSRVLTILRDESRALAINEIADRLGVHPNTVRFHVENLISAGRVEQAPVMPSGPGRPAWRVRAVPGMDPQGPRHYRALAEALSLALIDSPDPGGSAQRVGRTWSDRLLDSAPSTSVDPVSRLTSVLDALGFAPQRLTDSTIGLRHCPFLELTTTAGEVVCSVHLGLMKGMLDTLGADVAVSDLQPFVRPDLCVAHLAKRGTAAPEINP
ncbi:helix-turn-helix transcriptional regulator [Stackebrandtia endophytica]|nr:helix-turn-helix domain-containing protein [Stackebrandtia endophytica]